MKLTQAQANEFLSSLMAEAVEVVENDNESEFNREAALEKIDGIRAPLIKNTYENEWRSEFESKIAGKVGGTLERMLIRETGIDAKSLQGKKDEEKIRVALEFKNGQLDKDKAEWQDEVRRLATEKDEVAKTWEQKLAEKENEWKGKYNQKEIRNAFFSDLQKAPLNPKADRVELSKDFYQYMATKYHMGFDEVNAAVQYYKLDNHDMPAESDAPNGKIDIMKEAEAYFKPRGLWETDTRNVEMPAVGNNYTPSGKTVAPKGSPEALAEQRQKAYEQAGLTAQ